MATRYRLYRRCTACRHELTDHETFYSNGMCPYCGVVSGVTIVEHTKESELIPATERRREVTWVGFWIGVTLGIILMWAAT